MDETEILVDAQIGNSIRGHKLPSGHGRGTYHNPDTGQEFPNLPNDPFSREHYERRHRLQHDYSELTGDDRLRAAIGVKLVYGKAPVELKKKWDEREIKGEDGTDSQIKEQHANEELISMVKSLAQELRSLKNEIRDTKNDPYGKIEVEEIEAEPEDHLFVQQSFDLE